MPAILFVCMGNICRSPLAEGVFRHLVREAGIEGRADGGITCDSAGTTAFHVGDPPDARSIGVAARHGIDLSAQRARRVADRDFHAFDQVLAMDQNNLAGLRQRCPPGEQARLGLFLDYAPGLGISEVPDPYYGGPDGFEHCYALVREAAEGLLAEVIRNLSPARR